MTIVMNDGKEGGKGIKKKLVKIMKLCGSRSLSVKKLFKALNLSNTLNYKLKFINLLFVFILSSIDPLGLSILFTASYLKG